MTCPPGDTYVQIANISDAANPAIIHSRPVSSSVNDIEVCGDYVGYLENGIAHKNAQGMLHLMRAYNTTSRNWTDYLEIPGEENNNVTPLPKNN